MNQYAQMPRTCKRDKEVKIKNKKIITELLQLNLPSPDNLSWPQYNFTIPLITTSVTSNCSTKVTPDPLSIDVHGVACPKVIVHSVIKVESGFYWIP